MAQLINAVLGRNQRQRSEFFWGSGFLEINCKAYSISGIAVEIDIALIFPQEMDLMT